MAGREDAARHARGVDRILDIARTTLNVGADVVTACIIDAQVHGRQLEPIEKK